MPPNDGYIYIPNWAEYQHGNQRHHTWIKLHQKLLGNEAWLELNPSDAKLLITIWMVISKYGNGRVRAANGWLNAQANTRKGSIQRLNDAGFIDIRASKAVDKSYPESGDRKEVLRTSLRAGAPNGSAAPAEEEEIAPTNPIASADLAARARDFTATHRVDL